MTKITSSRIARRTMSAACVPGESGTPLTEGSSGSIYRIDGVSEQLAADAFGRTRPVGLWTRLGGRLRHALLGIHMVIPTVEAESEDGVLKNIRVVQECAFCPWRG